MTLKQITAIAIMTGVLAPVAAMAQQYSPDVHAQAKYDQERSDARHHTKAKVVGGSAAAGAVGGALLGGPKGAVVGAGLGAGAGVLANKARKHNDIKKREAAETGYR